MIDITRRNLFGWLLVSVGIAFAIAGLTLWFALIRPETTELNQAVLGIIVHVLFGYIVVMAGITVSRDELPLDQCFIATKWTFGGAAFMGLLVVWRSIPEIRAGSITFSMLNEFVIVASVGAAAGVLVGLNRGQAVRNRELVSEKEDREETLVFLLRLLEHDIGNHLLAISNHARSIRPSTFDPSPTPSEAIEERAANIERLLETANVVLESETGDGEFSRINLALILREQIDVARTGAPEVEIETDIEDELYVESDRFIGDVFRNLLDNAIVHNPSEDLTISVTGQVVDETVVVEIVDNGIGIPVHIRNELFNPGVKGDGSSGDGVGLYLVKKLLKSYGGTVSVSDRTPNGTRFTLRFSHASEDPDTS